MLNADCYQEWLEAAIAVDQRNGSQRWRQTERSGHFDYLSIRRRLDHLRKLRARHDYPGLLFTLNEGIHGNVDGMGNPELFRHCRVGTKHLIEEYVDEVVDALKVLATLPGDVLSRDLMEDFFDRAHHCFGQSALMMSGSGMLLYFHVGVAKSLWQHDLLPNIISGSSGGAVVGSMLATHEDKKLDGIFDAGHLAQEFEPTRAGFWQKVHPKIMKVEQVEIILNRLVPDMTFQEAYESTRRCVNISIAPAEAQQTSRLLNTITSPNVLIRESILASTALPGFFAPVALKARGESGDRTDYQPARKWVDGALSDDLPARRLARLYGVNHFIVSQTNPHVIPWVSDSKRSNATIDLVKLAATRTAREWINVAASVLRKPLSNKPGLNRAASTALAILNQDYIGDINILPPFRFHKPTRLLSHLSEQEIADLIAMGERSTWPKIEMIRLQTKISRNLEQIRQENGWVN